MASTIKVNTLDTQTGTELALAATKKITGDNTQFKITGGANTNVLTTDGAGVLTWGAIAAGFTGVHADVTSGSEIYTVPTGVTNLLVFITGGGGGGGTGVYNTNNGTGGGAAGTVIASVTVVAADTITIAIGAGGASATVGGDSTFTHTSGSGSFDTITGPGGRPGTYASQTSAPTAPTVGSSNDGIAIKGGWPMNFLTSAGQGAASFWGGGGQGGYLNTTNPVAADAFGAGGGGGGYWTSAISGGAGAVGVCFIMEFK
jgi:hypothetical protein